MPTFTPVDHDPFEGASPDFSEYLKVVSDGLNPNNVKIMNPKPMGLMREGGGASKPRSEIDTVHAAWDKLSSKALDTMNARRSEKGMKPLTDKDRPLIPATAVAKELGVPLAEAANMFDRLDRDMGAATIGGYKFKPMGSGVARLDKFTPVVHELTGRRYYAIGFEGPPKPSYGGAQQ